ncbi:MAG: glycerol-3-phosphate dehydrogenase/oxidase [Kiritimatiellaeota bacterium]|nr:glycerol-3-phosphate dehydrogenase/oxidase [Kiritimatiellota bacterium]
MTREKMWQRLKGQTDCDVLILGGGVNGTGLLRELALQGVRCVLVDKADFAAGASSKSSRMIHGGLRYLENAEFRLVSESVLERNRLLKYAPHYVQPLKTTIPIISWFAGMIKAPLIFFGMNLKVGGRGAFIVKMGLTFYDILTCRLRQTPWNYLMGKKRSLREIPGLRGDIVCTATYWDAWISQPERLCVEMALEACRAQPECVALNYVEAQKLGADSVALTDTLTGETFTLRPKTVVNATGAWVDFANRPMGIDSRLMGGTKGSHLVIDNAALFNALGDRMIYYEHADGRICITFRFMDKVIMGSTDIRIQNPDDAACDDAEIDYMMTTLRGVFPDIEIARTDIVHIFCGVRPLMASGEGYTSKVSRSHFLAEHAPDGDRAFPVYSMVGGKLTTFRAFAEMTADKVLPVLGKTRTVSTADRPYPGRAPVAEGERLRTLPDYTVEEIRAIAQQELIAHLSDLTRRRSVITLLGQLTEATATELATIVGDIFGWDEPTRQNEIRLALQEAQGRS